VRRFAVTRGGTGLRLIAVAVALGASAEAGPGRRGQVVRVERARKARMSSVHLCVLQPRYSYVICAGEKPPPIGERISLVSLTGFGAGPGVAAGGQVWVTSTGRFDEDRCGTGSMHAVYVRGDLSPGNTSFLIGFTGLDLPATSRAMFSDSVTLPDVDGVAYKAELGIDTDGNDGPELVIGRNHQCPPVGAATDAECYGYFRADGDAWKLVGQDAIYSCR
jgi:hypothetical protein